MKITSAKNVLIILAALVSTVYAVGPAEDEDIDKALLFFNKAAAKDPAAQFRLGYIYLYIDTLPVTDNSDSLRIKVINCPQKAAEQEEEKANRALSSKQPLKENAKGFSGSGKKEGTVKSSKSSRLIYADYRPAPIHPHQISEIYGSGQRGYGPMERATIVDEKGKITTSVGTLNPPPGMKAVVVHSGRPDNGTEWGKHGKYVPKTNAELFRDNAAAAFIGAYNCYAALENRDYGSAIKYGEVIINTVGFFLKAYMESKN